LDEKRSELSKKRFIRKNMGGDLDSRTGIRAKEPSTCGRNGAGFRGNFEYLESNLIGKHAHYDSGILSSNMHYEDI